MFWSQGDGFWEREPVGWIDGGSEKRWTRSVKLGALGDQAEGKKTRVGPERMSGCWALVSRTDPAVVLRIQPASTNACHGGTEPTHQRYRKPVRACRC